MGVLSNIEPKIVFQYFEKISQIPHGSGDVKRLSDYCANFARERGLRYHQDESNNIIIFKDASLGYESHEPVILQGHLDMVCEKEEGLDKDFTNEGLELEIKDGYLKAKGTTLGGDDGIAIAYCLAVLDSKNLQHPPLEIVLTADEEIGMIGAINLDKSLLKGKKMLNIDSEEEGKLLVGCAGGLSVVCNIPVKYIYKSGVIALISVDKLLGGHSGVEIDKGRANANKLLGEILNKIRSEIDINIIDIRGGNKDNAIPRNSEVKVMLSDKDLELMERKIDEIREEIKNEYRITDKNIEVKLKIEGLKESINVLDKDSVERVINCLMVIPNGVIRRSYDIDGLVETSLNLGIMELTEGVLKMSFSVRSSLESQKEKLKETLNSLMELLGGHIECSGQYPAWEYKEQSKLREVMLDVYREQYGEEMEVCSIHAGVECGLFSGELKGLDVVSFGPNLRDVHTPDESMELESVKRTWCYLIEVLKHL